MRLVNSTTYACVKIQSYDTERGKGNRQLLRWVRNQTLLSKIYVKLKC